VSNALFQIKGFSELTLQLIRLEDSVKRRELLKVLGQVANPTLKAAVSLAPVSDKVHYRYTGVKKRIRRKKVTGMHKIAIHPGNLKASIKKIVARKAKDKAVLHIGAKAARIKGKKPDGYYAHMLVKKGFTGTSRLGRTYDFLQKAYERTQGAVTPDAEKKVARYVKKQINRLSTL